MAIDRKWVDLINAEIDGQISAEDQALLNQHLAENDEAMRFRNELALLCGELDTMPDLDPPADLRHPALAGAGGSAGTSRKTARHNWLVTFNEFLGIAPVRYAMSFAAGAVLTFVLVSSDQISRRAFDDVTGLVGTMSERGMLNDTARVGSMGLTLNELAGSVSLNRSGPLLILDFDLAAKGPVDIVALFDDRDIWFNGFAQLESTGTSVAAQTGRVTIRMEGQRRYAVYLHSTGRNAATVRLQFFSAGKLLHEGELSFTDNN